MNKVSYAIKIDPHIVNRIKKFCLEHGIKQGFFVEKALREQLAREELTEDLLDFKTLRAQEGTAISFEEYLKKRAH
jgi:predicted transcriptional regulator